MIVVATLPLVPIFAILIGLTTQESADRQWRALGDLAGHFLDVVRGLPTLVAHRRAEAQVPKIRTRSEKHTSELQSLLRISYAVFCLKKKIQPQLQKIKKIKTQ